VEHDEERHMFGRVQFFMPYTLLDYQKVQNVDVEDALHLRVIVVILEND